jgi:hypothetical protein
LARHFFNTVHPGEKKPGALGCARKEFRSINDVSPIMRADENSSLAPSAIMGASILRMVAFRDRATASPTSDFDHFKRVNNDTAMGAKGLVHANNTLPDKVSN